MDPSIKPFVETDADICLHSKIQTFKCSDLKVPRRVQTQAAQWYGVDYTKMDPSIKPFVETDVEKIVAAWDGCSRLPAPIVEPNVPGLGPVTQVRYSVSFFPSKDSKTQKYWIYIHENLVYQLFVETDVERIVAAWDGCSRLPAPIVEPNVPGLGPVTQVTLEAHGVVSGKTVILPADMTTGTFQSDSRKDPNRRAYSPRLR
jgi:hypothetical protein